MRHAQMRSDRRVDAKIMELTRQPKLSAKVFVPFSEELAERLAPLGELVPFELDYPCLRATVTPPGSTKRADDPASPHAGDRSV